MSYLFMLTMGHIYSNIL